MMFDAAAANDGVNAAGSGSVDLPPPAVATDARDTATPPTQLRPTTGVSLSTHADAGLSAALNEVNATLTRLPDRASFPDLVQACFGGTTSPKDVFDQRLEALTQALQHQGLSIAVELRSNADLKGAWGAYAAHGPDGTERIYLNADWIEAGASSTDISKVLLEEAGHAFDQRLNGALDSAGDEGERFAAMVRGETLSAVRSAAMSADADQTTLVLDGQRVDVEFAQLSLPFSEGFIGVQGSSANAAESILTFNTLGITRASFFQDSSTGAFTEQGNDIPGGVRLSLASGEVITINGTINWRDAQGSTLHAFGFIPNPSLTPVSFTYGSGSTFTITASSNFGLEKVDATKIYTDHTSVTGNAATSGLLTALNTYLALVQANDPNGPVSVDSQTTTDTTPTLTGLATLGAGETLSVEVGGRTYTASDGLSVSGGHWSLTLPAGDALSPGTHSVTATITNASGYTLVDTTVSELTITAPDSVPPTVTGPGSATGLTSAKSIPENTTAVHTFSASEPVTWTLDGGADAAKFSIDASGHLSFLSAPNFEAPTDLGDAAGNNTYVVVVKATDGSGNTTSQTVTVTVTDVDDTAPTVTGPGSATGLTSAKSVPENTTAVHTFSASEPVTWAVDGGADAAKFSIDASGHLSFLSAPNFEAPTDLGDTASNNTYVVVVKATDGSGNTTSQTVTVTVTDVDDTAPTVTGPGSATGLTSAKSVPENTTAVHSFSASEPVTWTLDGGADAAKFSIDASGHLSFLSAPNFEAPTDLGDTAGNNTYVVVVKATDGSGNTTSQTVTVTVTVTDVDDTAPTVTGPGSATGLTSAKSVPENTTAVHTFSASESVTWAVDGGADAAKFSIDASGHLSFLSAPNFEAPTDLGDTAGNNTYVVVVKATDGSGNTTSQTVTVTVTDVNETPANRAPTPGDDSSPGWDAERQRYTAETPKNTPVQGQVRGGDPDGDTLAYSISREAGQGTVTIDPATGAWTYTPLTGHVGTDRFEVRVSDGRGGESVVTVVVEVTPTNAAPRWTDGALDTPQDQPHAGRLPVATDADGDALTYAVVGQPAHGRVSVDADGRYTYTPAAGFHGADRFQVRVTDAAGATADAWIEVTVRPAPTLGLPAPWDLGSSDSDRVTSAPVITLAGEASAGQTLRLYAPSGALIATVTADAQGRWSVADIDLRTLTSDAAGATAGAAGPYTFTLRPVDSAGAEGPAVGLTVVRELPAPPPIASQPPIAESRPGPPTPPPQAAEVGRSIATPFDSALKPATASAGDPLVVTDSQEPMRSPAAPANDLDNNTGDIYTRPSGFRTMVKPDPEPTLRLFNGIDDQVVKLGQAMNLQVPADTFVHTQINETVRLQATQVDGTPLPAWLRFDGKNGTLVGEPPPGWSRDIAVKITARDSKGREATATFRIKVGDTGARPGAGLSRQLMQAHTAPAEGAAPRA